MSALLWDQHTCLPLDPHADVTELARYDRDGGALLSVNVGYSPHTFDDVRAIMRGFSDAVTAEPALELAHTIQDVDRVTRGDRIAVVFDLEDAGPLGTDLTRLEVLRDGGLRTLALTYNYANAAGGGCLDPIDEGLTGWGRQIVATLNDVGVVPDCSHCGSRTGVDICATSTLPVVYSHSSMRSVWDHPRNITDDQARACADTGGVIGITGVGIFLGPNTPTLDAMVAHLEYAVELVGIDHVGVSTDYSFDFEDFRREIADSPDRFDDSYTRWGPIEWMTPETFLHLTERLDAGGWSAADIRAVMGGNFHRVAAASWQ